MSLAQHLRCAAMQTPGIHVAKEISQAGRQVIVSEWSLAMPRSGGCLCVEELSSLTRSEHNAFFRSLFLRQLRAFAMHTQGWFFWEWKDEDSWQWSLWESAKRGVVLLSSPSEPRIQPSKNVTKGRSNRKGSDSMKRKKGI
eukprot:gnl/TRDRNA2_/TRDRNA2_203490_c0_seq1.p1 gnl/TRDRNA2_/TRDRNA2_203490_c0~~gnl/TRDRNA2_/TRDRNA2_203490_c0_seq1.p1  ORF type:complete len:141 (-),score=20.46 gnl/TRDRNA2_/TRDRNA2_203490_c0_seq1:407-829(-)